MDNIILAYFQCLFKKEKNEQTIEVGKKEMLHRKRFFQKETSVPKSKDLWQYFI